MPYYKSVPLTCNTTIIASDFVLYFWPNKFDTDYEGLSVPQVFSTQMFFLYGLDNRLIIKQGYWQTINATSNYCLQIAPHRVLISNCIVREALSDESKLLVVRVMCEQHTHRELSININTNHQRSSSYWLSVPSGYFIWSYISSNIQL